MTALFPKIDMPSRLEVTNLTMTRGDNTLFEGLSASVHSGDVLWVQGGNGIGKTTFLEAVAGLSRPDHGYISWIKGEDITTAHQLIAYQPHRSFSKATLTTKEDLHFWAKLNHALSLTDEALNHVGLSMRASVPTQNLSAGQRRRLALAKLIISQKPVWIMDEPGATMDKDGATLIDDLIGRHIARGGSAVIASHDSPRKLSANTRKLTLRAAA